MAGMDHSGWERNRGSGSLRQDGVRRGRQQPVDLVRIRLSHG
ncbi:MULTISPECIES: hypothetical protein [unclassified Paenibacillus]|nr:MULTISPECIES: hypothetical protein [unclassified Paenibacillus]SIQ77070.1 hypothetical protein SAMN05880555_2276 [Paenibacillus sp. RU4X]SIQ98491.1 hypothetical protein SAMN05880570_2275 [Paenibacillus sp. RU4T]